MRVSVSPVAQPSFVTRIPEVGEVFEGYTTGFPVMRTSKEDEDGFFVGVYLRDGSVARCSLDLPRRILRQVGDLTFERIRQ